MSKDACLWKRDADGCIKAKCEYWNDGCPLWNELQKAISDNDPRGCMITHSKFLRKDTK